MSEDRVQLISEVLAAEERASRVSPLMKEVADAELAGIAEGEKVGPADDGWQRWMSRFRASRRDDRLQILSNWNTRLSNQARRYPPNQFSVWQDRYGEMRVAHELLERAGR
jgi:hypothetical protein